MIIKKDISGRIALFLVLLIITMWFLSHFRMGIVPLKYNPSVHTEEYYKCPGVGLRLKDLTSQGNCTSFCLVECTYDHTEQLIKNNPEGEGIIFYWD